MITYFIYDNNGLGLTYFKSTHLLQYEIGDTIRLHDKNGFDVFQTYKVTNIKRQTEINSQDSLVAVEYHIIINCEPYN